MRTDIYYWKCDCPLPAEGKLVYNDKYALADISEMVRSVAIDHFGREPVAVRAAKGEGNHYAYLIETEERTVFFRADDGKLDDDYMDAECAVMKAVGARRRRAREFVDRGEHRLSALAGDLCLLVQFPCRCTTSTR